MNPQLFFYPYKAILAYSFPLKWGGMAKTKVSKEAPATRLRGKTAPAPKDKKVVKKDKKDKKSEKQRQSKTKEKEAKKKQQKAIEDSQESKPNKNTTLAQEKKRHNEKNLKDMEKQSTNATKKQKKETTKKDGKEKKQSPKTRAVVPSTPVKNNKSLQSSNSNASSTGTPSGSLDTLSDVEKEAEKAKAKGISLADHMEDESAKALEQHMQQLLKEQGGEEAQESEESEESEEDAEQSDGEMSVADSNEDDKAEKEEEQEEEQEAQVQALQVLGACPDNKSDDESQESCDSSDAGSSSESESEEDEKKKKKEKEMQALVSVSDNVSKKRANSTTNKSDWDKFSRQCMDKKKFPQELATHFLKDKVCLFNEWLSCGGDWSKVSLIYERQVEDKRKFKKQRKGMKGRDIIAAYGETRLGSFLESSTMFKPRKKHLFLRSIFRL